MFLKRLEIQGFKSFADRAEIQFVPGITAIVGPNGSGKSNLVDAMLWALGESNVRNLRGATASDIIFAGSEGKRRLGMASVSLTLDNESGRLPIDFNEVTVTRRVYRSGDGEFLINQSQCRLRDIYELFLDTGVGREAYSIVTQGHIDSVISSRPEERRELLEEAAGVKKYRWKKRETIKRLDQVERNLERVRDILAEIEPRLDPLEKQASDARRYREIHGDFRIGQLALYLAECGSFGSSSYDVEQKVNQAKAEALGIDAAVVDAEQAIADAKAALAHVSADEETLREEYGEATRRLDRAEAELSMLKRDLSRVREQVDSAAATLSRADAERDEMGAERERLEQELAQAAASCRRLEAELEAAQDAADRLQTEAEAIEDDVPVRAEEVEALQAQLAELRSRLHDIAEQSGGYSEAIARAESEEANDLAEIARLEAEIASARLSARAAQGAAEEMGRKLEAASTELGSVSGRSHTLADNFTHVQSELASKESRLRTLVEVEDSREGYAAGPRSVLLAATEGKLSGDYQPVSEILQVPSDYERAIEIALGPALQHIVTKDEDEARSAIEYLKDKRAGRATFLPLTNVRDRSDATVLDRLLKMPGVIGRASDLVFCDSKHRAIINFLLSKTLVIDSMDTGFKLRGEWGWSKLVTLDGELFYPSGAVAGGWFKRDAQPGGGSPLARQREIVSLRESVGTLRGKLNEYERDLISTRTLLVRVGDDEADLRRTQMVARVELERSSGRVMELENAASVCRERMGTYGDRKLQAAEALNRLGMEEERLAAEVQALDRKLLDQQRITSRQSPARDELADKVDAAAARLVEVRVAMATAQAQENALRTTIERARVDAERALRRHKEAAESKDTLATRIAGHEQGVAEAAKLVEEIQGTANERGERLRVQREARAHAGVRVAESERELSALFRRREALREELYQAERSMAEIRVRREQLGSRLADEYGVDLAASSCTADGWYLAALPEDERMDIDFEIPDGPVTIPATEEDLLALRRIVRAQSKEIRQMGIVNLAAIEEYDTLRDRHEFLTREHNDLVESRQSLIEAMHELDSTTRGAFMDVFDKVGAAFERIFKRIFGGGSCKLVLTDPNDLLNTGVEVIAQPPGKKLTNLVLLSGGERALTATAVIFALLEVKPSPFCVIDELDAPLDDTNVDRYIELLRDFSERSQFVVVTHNRRTMAAADALYGVTMESPGASKLISVRLVERAQTVATGLQTDDHGLGTRD